MAKVKLEFPIEGISGTVNGMIIRKTRSGYYTAYRKPKRDYICHPRTEKEKNSQKTFARAVELAKEIESNPALLESYQPGYEVYTKTVKSTITMHEYLIKCCYVLAKREMSEQDASSAG